MDVKRLSKKMLASLAMSMLCMATAFAQNGLKGTVKDQSGEPVVGANVVVVGTTNGAMSDLDGSFEIKKIASDATVQVSYIGYKTQTVKVNNRSQLNIVLEEDTAQLDEVIVVGYGTTSKRKTTSAVSTVNADAIAAVPVPNITQSLAGRAPGLIVQQSGGGIDVAANVSIRGGGTPLYVIDNVICEQRDFNNINPDDIESMSILKDASATAIYGARAANGIIIVTTKRGQAGKINVDYSFNYSMSQPAYLPKKLSSAEAAWFINRGNEYDGYTAPYTEEDLRLFSDGSDPRGHANTDWQDVTMRSVAPEMRHNLTVTGGNETIKAYAGLSYYDQESIYRTNSHNMQRYNLRTNLEINLKSIGLKVTPAVEAYITNKLDPSSNYYFVWSHVQNKAPWEPARNPFGQIYSGTTDNPLLDISDEGGYVKSTNSSVRGNITAEWAVPWVAGLTIKAIGSYTMANDRSKSWSKNATAYDWDGNPNTPNKPSLSKSANYHSNFNTQLLADYTRTFAGKHTVGATFGIEASGSDYDNLSASRQNFVIDVDQMGAGPTDGMNNSSSEGINYRRAALVARVKYDYAAKYIIEANLRYDGSDLFPQDRRWGTFFSGSAAWVVSEERFWESLGIKKVLEQFKIRASYGEIGLDSGVNRYSFMTSYSLNQRGAYIGGQWVPTFSEGNLVSVDTSWYKTKDFDLGIDFTSLNGRLSGSIDYFAKVTTGYLASPQNVGYIAPLGKSLPVVKTNGESIRRGVEFIVSWKDHVGDFTYGISANMTYYDDRWNIDPSESETSLKNPYTRWTQQHDYYGNLYTNLGYYADAADIMNSPKRDNSTNLMAGDLKYYDFNGDGKIDGSDQIRAGAGSSPDTNFGINVDLGYKGWSFNMLWQGASNYNLYLDGIRMVGNSNYQPVIYEFQRDQWAPDNRNATYPRQHASSGSNGGNNFVGSDFWLVDSRYIRLKNLSIGYDFKHTLLKNVKWMSKCRLAFTGYNLLTFSPATKFGFDPEAGRSDGYSYPVSRVYSFSLNIGF